jgi:hypothetical protein
MEQVCRLPTSRWECIAAEPVSQEGDRVVLAVSAADVPIVRDLEEYAIKFAASSGHGIVDSDAVPACGYSPECGVVVRLTLAKYTQLALGAGAQNLSICVDSVHAGTGVVRLHWRVKASRDMQCDLDPDLDAKGVELKERAESGLQALEHKVSEMRAEATPADVIDWLTRHKLIPQGRRTRAS